MATESVIVKAGKTVTKTIGNGGVQTVVGNDSDQIKVAKHEAARLIAQGICTAVG